MQQQDSNLRIDNFIDIVKYLEMNGSILSPCTPEEVSAVEAFYNVQLPGLYKDFLLKMGKNVTDYMEGSYVYYNYIFDLRRMANDIIKESNLENLQAEDFVFWSHQGYIFAYFKVNEGANPAVYVVYEWGQVIKIQSLFEWFKAELNLDGSINA